MESIDKGFANGMKERNDRKIFVAIYILSLLCIIFAPFLGKVFILIAILLFALALASLPTAYNYSLLFGLFPFANIFKLAPDSMSLMTLCEMLLLAKIVLVLIARDKPVKCSLGLFFGFSFTILYMVVFSSQLSLAGVIKLAVRIVLVAYYLRSDIPRMGGMSIVKTTAYVFSTSMLIMMILGQITPYIDSVSDYLRTLHHNADRDIVRSGGLLTDPNYCAVAILVSMAFISVLYYYKKVKNEYWLLVVPLFLLGFTTYSKSYFLTATAFVIILLLLILFPKHRSWAVALCVVITVAAAAIFAGKIEVINKVLLRFDTDDITTGRADLNAQYLSHIFSNLKVLFFGEGYNVTTLPDTNVVHNLYIEILFRLGLVGSLLFVGTVKCCFPRKQKKVKLVNYMPAMFTAVMFMALSGLDTYGLFYYILLSGISVLHISNDGDEEKQLSTQKDIVGKAARADV